jgi:hypothetical protein
MSKQSNVIAKSDTGLPTLPRVFDPMDKNVNFMVSCCFHTHKYRHDSVEIFHWLGI